MLYYNTPMPETAPAPAPSCAAVRENARERVADARFCAPPALRLSALRLSAWGRLAMVAPIALALWAGVFWALH